MVYNFFLSNARNVVLCAAIRVCLCTCFRNKILFHMVIWIRGEFKLFCCCQNNVVSTTNVFRSFFFFWKMVFLSFSIREGDETYHKVISSGRLSISFVDRPCVYFIHTFHTRHSRNLFRIYKKCFLKYFWWFGML